MRSALLLAFVALGACVPSVPTSAESSPPPDSSDQFDTPAESSQPPDLVQAQGFEVWLSELCPDGTSLNLMDAATGELHPMGTCETARARALANEPVRQQLVTLYASEMAMPATPAGDEPIGKSAQHFSPFSLVCGIVAASVGLAFNWPFGGHAGCKDPRANNPRACEAVTGGGSVALGLLCALI